MFVTLEVNSHGIILREVDNEEEAFYEMRRFLEVNNVKLGDVTIQYVQSGARHAKWYFGMSPELANPDRTDFKYVQIGTWSFGICQEKSRYVLDFDLDKFKSITSLAHSLENYLVMYFNDLKKRTAVSEQCR